ncbi:hypothetical protein KQY27_06990 [Methanobrevibacter sp. TMH8]|uniref:hypothetical protein n=1 Tax=Methanobrevibacter sp. TMH8 TaxID=2848611 RepID=UPI001CC901F8|nr:hypothetical protein [Methanobrevibacter sp. TMH8]MBZ9571287.1 hypothetical protein [Methanobrevibacter sp. TMH8]
MFIKIRRDTLIILLLAFILILSGRLLTYIAFASSTQVEDGVPISGIIIKGNDIVPIDSIRVNIANSGLRSGSYIKGDMLITSKRELPLNEAIKNAQEFATYTTIPGTTVQPIAAADVKVDKSTGIVTVTVIEDFSTVDLSNKTSKTPPS